MPTPRRLFAALAALVLALASGVGQEAPKSAADQKKNYIHTLQLGDRVRIAVYQEDDLLSNPRIDARGRVNLPLVGEVGIGGMTLAQAQKMIEDAYKDGRFLRNPQVTITVEEYAPREVSIQGAIRNAGRYVLPVESTFTVVELVTKAGGFTDIAKGTAVTITRIAPDGSKRVFTVDVESLIRGRRGARTNADILLQPGDIVYVPESLI